MTEHSLWRDVIFAPDGGNIAFWLLVGLGVLSGLLVWLSITPADETMVFLFGAAVQTTAVTAVLAYRSHRQMNDVRRKRS